MPVRSINIKLVVSRQSVHLQSARDLWTTHAAVNMAVAYYESLLLEMRGEDYLITGDTLVTANEVCERLDRRIRDACHDNGLSRTLTDLELSVIRGELRKIYEAIVPSSIGEKGDAQQANAYISPLTDADSKGFLLIFDKIGTPPSWLEGVRNGESDAFEEANAWLESPEGKKRMEATGAPPKWVRLARERDAGWPDAFVKDFDSKLAEADGVPAIIKKLKEKKVLPLFGAFLAPQIDGSEGKLSRWDRLAFRLAVGHLLSWESWCRISAEDHALRCKKYEDFVATHLEREELLDAVQALRRYETERHQELCSLGLPPVSLFRIRNRMVRSWKQLLERWLTSKDRTLDSLLAISVSLQTKLKGAFGDPHLFAWLARPENHHIWSGRGADAVMLVATANRLDSLVARSRDHAIMTLPDPVLHPRSPQWEPPSGTNLKNYSLSVNSGRLTATLPLLQNTPEDSLKEIQTIFCLASSGQLQNPVLGRKGKEVTIAYQNQTGELYTGILKSADLLFDWSHFRHRSSELLAAGDIGPAYLKLVVDVAPTLPEGWDGKRPKFINHYTSALGNDKHFESAVPGMRMLSVDLGLRCFATCSVFELKDAAPPTNKLAYPAGNGLWAVHERSFQLRLPGEAIDSRGEAWRRSAMDELRGIRRMLNRCRSYNQLDSASPTDRETILANMETALIEIGGGLPFERDLLATLRNCIKQDDSTWKQSVSAARLGYRREIGTIIGEWRRRTRRRDSGKGIGKSMWAIEYLTDVRRLLVGWSLLGSESGDIRRLDRAGRGIFARRLLDHIDGIKDDRLKTGADLIVQAARGCLRDETGNWSKRYAPCHAILFEDLSRYRMKTDRPKRENSQLMRWSHRQMPDSVSLQGELYGIHVCKTDAAFSSRYHAYSMAPGVRCHPLSAGDLKNSHLRQIIQIENPDIVWNSLKPGDLVPLSGGELFACLGDGGVIRVNADINAAQNLQRRFWTRYADQIRIPCKLVMAGGSERWIPKSMGKRLMGAMGGYGWLVPTGNQGGSCQWKPLTPKQWRAVGGVTAEDASPSGDEMFDLDGIEESVLIESGEVVIFFRDPSGFVLPDKHWVPAKQFWGLVKTRSARAILGL